jgi:urease accessory protein
MNMGSDMTMTTNTATDESDAQYRLLAWMSPAFPVGGFSYSHGLEFAIEIGNVASRDDAETYIVSALEQGAARSDAILLCAAWRAAAGGDENAYLAIAERAAAMRATAEFALESIGQGEAFLSAVDAAWPRLRVGRWRARLAERGISTAYPVAVALAAARAGISLEAALPAYLQAFAAGLVAAAVKLVPLGQTDGQRIVAALEPHVAAATKAAFGRTLDDLGSAAPLLDIWSARHETQYTRLFRS